MKKKLPVFCIIVAIFTIVGCSNTVAKNGHTASEPSVVSNNKSTNEQKIDGQDKSQTDSTKEATPVKKITTMNIAIGNTAFTATFEDNETAKAFAKQLPLTVDMAELNGNEKYNYLSNNLRADAASCPGKISEGDLMLYDNNCLVLFYKTFNTSYRYVKIGHIDDTIGLNRAIGSGGVKITFSVSE